MTRPTIIERFDAKIEKPDGDDGCWLWTASTGPNGYGRFWDGIRQVLAHRWSYEHCIAPIPDGLQIDHLCRVRNCANPRHLEPVTAGENVRRGDVFGQRPKTRCKYGHPLKGDNLKTKDHPSGRTIFMCITCNRNHQRKYDAEVLGKRSTPSRRKPLPNALDQTKC